MVAAVVLAGLILAAGLSGRLGRAGILLLAGMSVLWLLVNGPMEGPTLLVVLPDHGLTGADLAGLAGLAIAGVRGLAYVRRPSAG
jgi:hypothetical protein